MLFTFQVGDGSACYYQLMKGRRVCIVHLARTGGKDFGKRLFSGEDERISGDGCNDAVAIRDEPI